MTNKRAEKCIKITTGTKPTWSNNARLRDVTYARNAVTPTPLTYARNRATGNTVANHEIK